MSAAPPRLAAVLIVLVVCGASALALRSGGHDVPASRWAAAELVAPGLFGHDGMRTAWPFEATAPPADASLVRAALAPPETSASPDAAWSSPYVGLIPLWLALAAWLPARSPQGRRTAAALLALVVLALAGSMMLRQSFPLVAALAVSAGVGLRRIRPTPEGTDLRPQLVAAALCVLTTAALIGASLRAGFATDAAALQPLLARLDAGARARFDPSSLALEADHLRAVLDRAALAGFVGMTALLLHLKSRAPWSAALLLVVTAADVVSAAL